jgi:hypothetical protein
MTSIDAWNIRISQTTMWSPASASTLMRSLFSVFDKTPTSLRINASEAGISFRIVANSHPSVTTQSITTLVRAIYPNAEIIPHTSPPFIYPFYRRYTVAARVSPRYFDLLTPVTEHKTFDPLTLVSQTMHSLQHEEWISYMIMVDKIWRLSEEEILNATTISAYDAGWRTVQSGYIPLRTDWVGALGALVGMATRWHSNNRLKKDRVLRYSEAETEIILKKLQQPLALTLIYLTIDTPRQERLGLLSALAGAVYNIPGSHSQVRIAEGITKTHRITNETQEGANYAGNEIWQLSLQKKPTHPYTFYFVPEELASLWHLPHTGFAGQPIQWVSTFPQEVLSPAQRAVEIGLRADTRQSVFLSRQDRATHQYIAGKTGTGKSTLLHSLIHQDIVQGEGVAVIDPHGKLINDILERSIPASRIQDVLLLECDRDDYPVPLNPFRVPSKVAFVSAANALYWAARKIYEGIWLDGQSDMVMRHVIHALLCDPEATPLDIRRLFTSDSYRRHIVQLMSKHKDVPLDTWQYWNEFEARSAGDKREIAKPIINRTSAFLGNRTLELMTCHPSTINFQECITKRKIVLINLAGQSIRNEVSSLGVMFFSGFFLASEALGYLKDGAPPRYYLYVDEIERFITTPLPDMFSQTRKFGLSLTMANQFLDQLSPETLRAILGNVGTFSLFELGITDAKAFANLLEPEITPDTLVRMGLYHMVVKTRVSGKSIPAFRAVTRGKPASIGVPYKRQATIPSFPSGEQVRAWVRERLQEPKQQGAPEQPAAFTPPKRPEVTDFE